MILSAIFNGEGTHHLCTFIITQALLDFESASSPNKINIHCRYSAVINLDLPIMKLPTNLVVVQPNFTPCYFSSRNSLRQSLLCIIFLRCWSCGMWIMECKILVYLKFNVYVSSFFLSTPLRTVDLHENSTGRQSDGKWKARFHSFSSQTVVFSIFLFFPFLLFLCAPLIYAWAFWIVSPMDHRRKNF